MGLFFILMENENRLEWDAKTWKPITDLSHLWNITSPEGSDNIMVYHSQYPGNYELIVFRFTEGVTSVITAKTGLLGAYKNPNRKTGTIAYMNKDGIIGYSTYRYDKNSIYAFYAFFQ